MLKHIQSMINTIENLNNEIKSAEKSYKLSKFEYTHKLLKLKYSDEYRQFKTIKEKEEHAKMDMESRNLELNVINNELMLQNLKFDKEVLMLQLKYLYTSDEE